MTKATSKDLHWILLCLLCILAGSVVAGWFSYKPWGLITSFLVFFFCVIGPGESLRRLLKLETNIAEFRWALAYGLGLVILPWIFSLWAYLGKPLGAIITLALGSMPAILGWRKPREPLAWKEIAWMVFAATALSLLIYLPAFRFLSSGAMTLLEVNVFGWDVKYNALLINAASNSFPPDNAFAAGQTLNYHMGYPDLLALMGLIGHQNSMDTLLRFAPLLLWTFGFLGCFGACLGMGLNRPQARIATLLINLGGGVFAVLIMLFKGFNHISVLSSLKLITISNFISNPTIVAVPLVMIALAAIGKHLSDKEKEWGIGALLLTAAIALYKSFFHPVILAAWFLSLVMMRIRGRRINPGYFFLSSLLALPIWIWYMLQNISGAGLKLKITAGFLHIMGDIPFHWSQWLYDRYTQGGLIESWAVVVAGSVILLIWLFGVGVLGVPSLLKHLIGRGKDILTPASWVVVTGVLASALLYDEPHVHVSSEWFMICSQFVLLLFAVPSIERVFSRPIAAFLFAVVLFCGAVQTVSYLSFHRWRSQEQITARQVQSSFKVRQKTGGQAILAISEKEDMAPVILTGGTLYYHREFADMPTRYFSPKQAARRIENYALLFSDGRMPIDITGDRSFWVGFREGPAHSLFDNKQVIEKVGDSQGFWLRLRKNGDEALDK